MLGACYEDGPEKLYLVLEFCSRGALDDLLDDPKARGTWPGLRLGLAVGIAKCMRYLHVEQRHALGAL